MRSFNFGMDVVVSPLMRDEGKIKFNLFTDSPTVTAFNEWLRDQFGTKPTFYIIDSKKIICTPAVYAAIKEAARGDGK